MPIFFLTIYRTSDDSPYIQVDFKEPKFLSGVVTQGEGHEEKWVTEYEVYYSINGVDFIPYSDKQDGTAKLFRANFDGNSPVTNYFVENIIAQYIRIVPVSSHMGYAIRYVLLQLFQERLLEKSYLLFELNVFFFKNHFYFTHYILHVKESLKIKIN